jgi:hypothetical protein
VVKRKVASSWSVVIDDFNFVNLALAPHKADSPLVIDANAVLASTIPLQRLQAVAWINRENIQPCCGMEDLQLVQRPLLDRSRQFSGTRQLPHFLRLFAAEALDHGNKPMLERYVRQSNMLQKRIG